MSQNIADLVSLMPSYYREDTKERDILKEVLCIMSYVKLKSQFLKWEEYTFEFNTGYYSNG